MTDETLDPPPLEGRGALVTGAASGIGRAAAVVLAQRGADVVLVDQDEHALEEAHDEITSAGGRAAIAVADVSEVADMERAVAAAEELAGRLDVVFANAGVNGVWAPITDLQPEEWDETLRINLRGTFVTIRAAIPLLQRQGGSVIVTSSVQGSTMFSNPGATAYAASKAGQIAAAKYLALELSKDRIRVNVVCPGAIDTNIGDRTERRNTDDIQPGIDIDRPFPLDDAPGSAEDVARLVAFLASDESSHISGSVITIDGAESLVRG